MADTAQLNRIQKFYGGISGSDKDTKIGVASNVEEVDIFTNNDWIQPEKILVTDTTGIANEVYAYTLGDMDGNRDTTVLYAIGADSDGDNAEIWRKEDAQSTSPDEWDNVETSNYTSNPKSPIKFHRVIVDTDDAALGEGHFDPITRVGTTATLKTLYSHGLDTGSYVAISVAGADQSAYNGVFRGQVIDANTIEYELDDSADDYEAPDTPATALLSGGITVSFAFLYYVTGENKLTRMQIPYSASSSWPESQLDLAETPNSMVLSGLGGTNDKIPMEEYNGDLYIGHGRFIAKVDSSGICVTYAFQIPVGWRCVSFAPFARTLAILAESDSTGDTYSKVFYWDLTSESGVTDESVLAVGGPQVIFNFNEVLVALCVSDNKLYPFAIQNKKPALMNFLIEGVQSSTSTYPAIPDTTKFLKDNQVYFGMRCNEKTGLYTIGLTPAGYACVLAKRFSSAAVTSLTSTGTTATVNFDVGHGLSVGDDIIVSGANQSAYNGAFKVLTKPNSTRITYTMATTASATPATGTIKCTNKSYVNDIPMAAIGVGGNFYAAFVQGSTHKSVMGEGESQTRSSNAIYETTLLDVGDPETPKAWMGFLLGSKPLDSDMYIVVDAKTDNDSAYDILTAKVLSTANDQTDSGMTADTFWQRTWTSLWGRAIKIRLRLISDGTTGPVVYFVSFLSQRGNTI